MHRVGELDPGGAPVGRLPDDRLPLVPPGGDQPSGRAERDRRHLEVPGGVPLALAHRQRGVGTFPGATVGRSPDDRLAPAVAVEVGHPARHEPAVEGGDRDDLLAARAGQHGRVELLPGLTVGRVPRHAVLLVVDEPGPDGHEPVAGRRHGPHRLLTGGVERAPGAAVDAGPLGAVRTEPEAGPDLAPHVLAARDDRPAGPGGHVERPLLVLAAERRRAGCDPFAVGARPQRRVGLLAAADPADGDDAVLAAGGGRHGLVGRARARLVALPRGAVLGGPDGGDRPALVGVEHRPDDRPGAAVGGGSDQVGHVGHRALEGEGGAGGPGEGGRGGLAVARRCRAAGRHAGDGQADGGDARPPAGAPRLRAGRAGGMRLAGGAGARAPAGGVGVHGDPPVGGLPPTDVPVGRRFSPFAGRPVQSRRHVGRIEAPR